MNNKAIRFLSVAEVAQAHDDALARYGGKAGILNYNSFESAVFAPQWDHNYGENSLRRLAGSYIFHLVSNHPFAEANKRTGTTAGILFLEFNGQKPAPPNQDDLSALIWQLARGDISKLDFINSFLALLPPDLFQS